MPSWSIHIALADRINKNLNLGDDFILGNVIPDCFNGYVIKTSKKLKYSTTHYSSTKLKIDLDNFYNIYKDKFNNPIILGYYIHLFTDSYFNKYFTEHHKKNISEQKKYNKIAPYRLKQIDFETFGNYLIANKKLNVNISSKTHNYIKDLPFDIDKDTLNKVIIKINKLINKEHFKQEKYLVFHKKELNTLFETCYQNIMEMLNNK